MTIKRIHATLSSALAEAAQDGLLSENPASGARLPRVEKTQIEVSEPGDAGRFLDAASEHRLGVLGQDVGYMLKG